mmetsp:Transcript_42013/g.105971  ORF Transcript_42013/g.105971 Transcript_42013/m.105971 type:complete len:229 (+) Transcript_42013:308-994(+)
MGQREFETETRPKAPPSSIQTLIHQQKHQVNSTTISPKETNSFRTPENGAKTLSNNQQSHHKNYRATQEKYSKCSSNKQRKQRICLETATTATTLLASAVGRDRSHILNTANLDTTTGQGTQRTSGTRTRGLGSVTTLSTKLDVDGGHVDTLQTLNNVLSGQHGGVRAALITISLHLHATGNTAEGFTTGEISDVHEGIIEGSVDVRNSEQLLTFAELRAQTDLLSLG